MSGQSSVAPSPFSTFADPAGHSLHRIDQDGNTTGSPVGYNDCLTIIDEAADRPVSSDPEIIHRAGSI